MNINALTSIILFTFIVVIYGCNEKPLFIDHYTEDNGMEWSYNKYKNYINISVEGNTIISEYSDTIISRSDKFNTIFIAYNHNENKEYRYYLQNGEQLLSNEKLGEFDLIKDGLQGHGYITIGSYPNQGVYRLDGKEIVPFTRNHSCFVYDDNNFIFINVTDRSRNDWPNPTTIYDMDGNQLTPYYNYELNVEYRKKPYLDILSDAKSLSDITIVGFIASIGRDKFGVLNSSGQIIIPVEYGNAFLEGTSRDNKHCIWATVKDEQICYYNSTGMRIFTHTVNSDQDDITYYITAEHDQGNANDFLWLDVWKHTMRSDMHMVIDTLGNEIIPYQEYPIISVDRTFKEYRDGEYVDYTFPVHQQSFNNYYGLTYNIEFFDNDDHIKINGVSYERSGYHNGFATYEYSSWGNANSYIYIGSNYQAYDVMRMWNPYSCSYNYDFKKMTSSNEYQVKSYRDDDYNASIANFNSTTQTINSPEYDSDSRWRQYYIDNYRRNEHIVESNIGTLHTLQSDNNPNGTTIYSINTIKQSIQNAQRSMRSLRNEALSKGISISASYYETCQY